jgi:hypothetical protein
MVEDAVSPPEPDGGGIEAAAAMQWQPPPPPVPLAPLEPPSPATPAVLAVAVAVASSAGAINSPLPMDDETRAAVADLIATNRKLRRAVKERDAERATLR